MNTAMTKSIFGQRIRTFMTSRSINRLGHDSHGHGHDAHHHGPHPTFTPPYNAKLIGAITFGLVGGLGVLIPLLAVKFQNKKHGYSN